MYGYPNIGKFKSERVKVYEYLSMGLYYTTKKVKLICKSMWKLDWWISSKYRKSGTVTRPATKNLFKMDGSNPLNKNKA